MDMEEIEKLGFAFRFLSFGVIGGISKALF